MFRSLVFVPTFIAGNDATFTLFVPPNYLHLFASSIGLSSGIGAARVAAFNLCHAAVLFFNDTMSDKVESLVVFAILDGIANGAFFAVFPTEVASILDHDRAAAYLPLAALAKGAEAVGSDINTYRRVIFYAGRSSSAVFRLHALGSSQYVKADIRKRV